MIFKAIFSIGMALAASSAMAQNSGWLGRIASDVENAIGKSVQGASSDANGRSGSTSGAAGGSSSDSDRAVGELVRGIPSDATAKCRDGTFSKAGKRENACTRNNGVAIWYPGS
jgi:hypothetical protein